MASDAPASSLIFPRNSRYSSVNVLYRVYEYVLDVAGLVRLPYFPSRLPLRHHVQLIFSELQPFLPLYIILHYAETNDETLKSCIGFCTLASTCADVNQACPSPRQKFPFSPYTESREATPGNGQSSDSLSYYTTIFLRDLMI